MAFEYNINYGSFIRNQYDYPNEDYQVNPDDLNFGINYEGKVAAIWVGGNPGQYAYCDLTTDTSLTFAHSTGNLANFSVNSDLISLNSQLVNCQYEVRAPLGTFTSLSAPYKMFDIVHPTKKNKRLRHACLEGPEIAVYIKGKLSNESFIKIPDYWDNLVDPESINVSLTQIGSSQDLCVDKIDFPKRQINIRSNTKTKINCFYIVTATRIDVQKLEIEINDHTANQ